LNEELIGFLGFLLGVTATIKWYERLWCAAPPRSTATAAIRLLLTLLPVVLILVLGQALEAGAAAEVRGSGGYELMFVSLGAVYLAATVKALAWFGISAAEDAIERENLAAGLAVAGVMCAATFSYTCANLGEGSTIGTTIGPALLGFFSCAALWLLYVLLSGAPEAIAIERDAPSGLRFAAMAVASSFFVGRSLAGDYVSVSATLNDWWGKSWPALPLVLGMAVLQRVSRGVWR
jgi:hypothetical protein